MITHCDYWLYMSESSYALFLLYFRCLQGSFKQAHSYENQSLSTQQIRLSAAYSTNATVELRNMRNSLWSEQFLNVCGESVTLPLRSAIIYFLLTSVYFLNNSVMDVKIKKNNLL